MMELTWYGNAALVLREGERTLAFDPFCGVGYGELKRPPARLPYDRALGGAEDVLVTHGHFDHLLHIPRLYDRSAAAVYCTKTPAGTLARRGLDQNRLHVIGPGWQGELGPFTLRAYQGRHCEFDPPLVARTVLCRRFFRHPGHLARLLGLHLSCREAGEILFYEVACDGVRVQIMGSMGLDGKTDYPTGADALVLPLQGRSDQDTYALQYVRRLAPKRVIPDHWTDSFPPLTVAVDPAGFAENVEREFGVPCVIPKIGVGIDLNRGKEDR